MNVNQQFYSVTEVALKLGLSERTIRRAIGSGRLQTYQAGAKFKHRITQEQIEAYLNKGGK